MRQFSFVFAILVGFIILAVKPSQVRADDCPRYLVLRPLPVGQANGVQAREYSYGWFGAGNYSQSYWHRTYDGTGFRWTYLPGY
jgi:hypothetical protein